MGKIESTYQVRPHLIPETEIDVVCAAWRCVKRKPIDADLNLPSLGLKALRERDTESMMCWEDGSIGTYIAWHTSDVAYYSIYRRMKG